MKAVIQRVSQASVTIGNEKVAAIGHGLLVLIGIEDTDAQEDIDLLNAKIVQLRMFNDEYGVMNDSVTDVNGDVIVVSQFTFHSSTKKGIRPSYIKLSKPDIAI